MIDASPRSPRLCGEQHAREEAMIHLRHVALRCRDMEVSRRFYEMLGVRFIDYRPAGNALDLTDGALNMTLIQHDGEERPEMEEGSEYIHFGFMVDNAQCTFPRLRQAGALLRRCNLQPGNPTR